MGDFYNRGLWEKLSFFVGWGWNFVPGCIKSIDTHPENFSSKEQVIKKLLPKSLWQTYMKCTVHSTVSAWGQLLTWHSLFRVAFAFVPAWWHILGLVQQSSIQECPGQKYVVEIVSKNTSWHICRCWYQKTSCSNKVQSTLDISKLWGLFFTSSNYLKCKLICTSGNLTCKKVSYAKLWLEKAIKMYFWIR